MADVLTTLFRRFSRLPEGHDPASSFLRGLPFLAALFVFSATRVGHNEALMSALVAAVLLLVWVAGGLWPRSAAVICLLGLGYGSLLVMLAALVVTLHMKALQLPTGIVLLPLSVPLISNYWAISRMYRRRFSLALNVLYVALVVLVIWRVYALGYRDMHPVLVLGMSLVYVYSTHFTFRASTRSAVREARLEERIQASRDSLTGLRNRRAFNEDYLLSLWYPELPMGLLLLDIDHFKRVNDTHGHDAGDAVLVEVSRLAESVVGTRGRVYRWGGEEFAVLIPGWSVAELADMAELLRARVADSSFEVAGSLEVGSLTVSLGYGSVTRTESREPAFSEIDRALRQAKEGGRNRVMAALTAPPHPSERGESIVT
ncbi:diguanylate cyclase domain-containing protein [Deinococcus sp. UYEF24]